MSTLQFLMPRCRLPLQAQSFHTTSINAAESKRKQAARSVRRANQSRKEAAQQELQRTRPNMLTGVNRTQPYTWAKSKINNVMLDRDRDVWQIDETTNTTQTAPSLDAGLEPEELETTLEERQGQLLKGTYNFGLNKDDIDLLIENLPNVSSTIGSQTFDLDVDNQQAREDRESQKLDQFARIIDFKNANARGVRAENTRRMISEFQWGEWEPKPEEESSAKQKKTAKTNAGDNDGSGKSDPSNQSAKQDTGSPHVQVAVLTTRILTVQKHIASMPKDLANQRSLIRLVQQRRRVLKYLKRKNLANYERVLRECAIDKRAVEGELILTKAEIKDFRNEMPTLGVQLKEKNTAERPAPKQEQVLAISSGP